MADSNSISKGTILLTGANGSLGSGIVSKIVSTPELAGYHGIYTARNASSASTLDSALRAGNLTHNHNVLSLDLANLENVREVAANINSRVASGEIAPLRAIILNAGYLEFTTQTWSKDGFDMTFASNYLGHWLLTLLLLQSVDRKQGRVVIIGSESHDPFNAKSKAGFNSEKWQNFIVDSTEAIAKGSWSSTADDSTHHSGFRRYGASKFCQVLMIPELQRRLDADSALSNICVLGIDPGSMPGNLTRRGPWLIRVFIFQLIMPWLAPFMAWLQPNGPLSTIKKSAPDVLAAALHADPPIGSKPKSLYFYRSKLEETTAESKDTKKQKLLWEESIGFSGLKDGETILQNWS